MKISMAPPTAASTDRVEPVKTNARRLNGEGSVFFWPGRGWYAAITNTDGRRVMRKAPRQTERGAEAHLRTLLADRGRDALTRSSTTLEEFVEEWMSAVKRRAL